jgi:hypothetical protein
MPLIENWQICDASGSFTPEPGEPLFLRGAVFGHPNRPWIIEGEPCITTRLSSLDEAAKTAQTKNTLYQLGAQDQGFIDHLKQAGHKLAHYEEALRKGTHD